MERSISESQSREACQKYMQVNSETFEDLRMPEHWVPRLELRLARMGTSAFCQRDRGNPEDENKYWPLPICAKVLRFLLLGSALHGAAWQNLSARGEIASRARGVSS